MLPRMEIVECNVIVSSKSKKRCIGLVIIENSLDRTGFVGNKGRSCMVGTP